VQDHIENWLEKREEDGRGWKSPGTVAHILAEGFSKHVAAAERAAYIEGYVFCLTNPVSPEELRELARKYSERDEK